MVYGVTLNTVRLPYTYSRNEPTRSYRRVILTKGLFGEGNAIYQRDSKKGQRSPKFRMLVTAQIAPAGTIEYSLGNMVRLTDSNYGPDSDVSGYSVHGLRKDDIKFLSHSPRKHQLRLGTPRNTKTIPKMKTTLGELVEGLHSSSNAVVAVINPSVGEKYSTHATIQLYDLFDLPNDSSQAQELITKIRDAWRV